MLTATANKAIHNASNGLLRQPQPQRLTAAQKAARAAALAASVVPAAPAPTMPHAAVALPAAPAALPVAAAPRAAGTYLPHTWLPTSTIVWLAAGNPTRPGHGRHVRVAAIMAAASAGHTLATLYAGKVAYPRSVNYCVAKGWCAVVAPAA